MPHLFVAHITRLPISETTPVSRALLTAAMVISCLDAFCWDSPAIGTPFSGPSATWPYTSALLTMRGMMPGGALNSSKNGECQLSVDRSMRFVREALVTADRQAART